MLIELEFGGVGFCGGRKSGEPGEKPSKQGENQQQTQLTYGSHHCAIPAPLTMPLSTQVWCISAYRQN